MSTRHVRVWRSPDEPRMEFAEVAIGPESLAARGTQIAADPLPYRLEWQLETGGEYVTTALALRALGAGWTRTLTLTRNPADGRWSAEGGGEGDGLPPAGGDTTRLDGALDCDIAFCPVTNTMPVLRHGMLEGEGEGEPRDLSFAWVSVPDLAISRSEQRYEPLFNDADGATVRFVSLDSDFQANLRFDAHGLVTDYPRMAGLVGAG